MKKYFGTDGIRGLVNKEPMTAEFVLKLALAAGSIFIGKGGSNFHRVVIGKDTRLSGYMFEPALVAGFTSIGMDCLTLGPIPTPGVSRLTSSLRADLGVMISASHNPFHDNGIKLFGPDGKKLEDKVQDKISKLIDTHIKLIHPNKLGRVKRLEDACGRYVEAIKSYIPKNQRLDGLKIVLDCANGATYKVAPQILFELGANLVTSSVNPNGLNINEDCGSISPKKMSSLVLENNADVGIAFDGDGDRLILCDEKGEIINGDKMLAILAEKFFNEGILVDNTVVGTTMTNFALEDWLIKKGIKLIRTDVGDRYISEKIEKNKFTLGGEPSGHLLLPNLSVTGDALLNSLIILNILKSSGKKTSELFNKFEPYPQEIKNIKNNNPEILNDIKFINKIYELNKKIGSEGRIVVRESGTEPIIRIMVESKDINFIKYAIKTIENFFIK